MLFLKCYTMLLRGDELPFFSTLLGQLWEHQGTRGQQTSVLILGTSPSTLGQLPEAVCSQLHMLPGGLGPEACGCEQDKFGLDATGHMRWG